MRNYLIYTKQRQMSKAKDYLDDIGIINNYQLQKLDGTYISLIDVMKQYAQSDQAVQMAEQQLLGFAHAARGYSLQDLVNAMGLTPIEWAALQKYYTLSYLSCDDKQEINVILDDTNHDICEHCKKEHGTYQINPYNRDAGGLEIWEYICNDCYKYLVELSLTYRQHIVNKKL